MVSLTNLVIVMVVCIIGVGYSSYRLGVKRGAEATVQYMIDEGILEFEEED